MVTEAVCIRSVQGSTKDQHNCLLGAGMSSIAMHATAWNVLTPETRHIEH